MRPGGRARLLLTLGLSVGPLAAPALAQRYEQPNAFQGVFPTSYHGHPGRILGPGCPIPLPTAPAPQVVPAPVEPKAAPPAVAPKQEAAAPEPATPVFDPLTSAALGDTSVAMNFQPTMFGDLLSTSRVRPISPASVGRPVLVTVNGRTFVSSIPSSLVSSSPGFARLSSGSFKISDNDTPRPQDRAYVTYNYFAGVNPGSGLRDYDVSRETFGLEKTFLDRNASVSVRLPFSQPSYSFNGLQDDQVGDISLFGKYALLNDRTTGDVVTVGLGVTLPTGDAIRDFAGNDYHSTLYQPFVGWIRYLGPDLFVQAFHAIIFANPSDDVTAASNDIAVGYWLYRSPGGDGLLRGVVPTLEGHLYNPLNHRDSGGAIVANDVFTVTGGVTFLLGDRSALGVAGAMPLTGPRPNDYETIVTFNVRY